MPTPLDTLNETRAQLIDEIESMAADDKFNPADIEAKRDELDAINKRADYLAQMAEARESATKFTRPATQEREQAPADLGAELVKSPALKQYIRNGGGRAHLMSYPINRRALITSSVLPPNADRVVAAAPRSQTPMLDVLNNQMVSSGTVEVVTYPAAAPTAGVVAEGALKPEATFTPTIETHTLDTIAHWLEATRQVLEDEARLQDFISNSLLRGVYDKAEGEAAGVIQAGTYATADSDNMLKSLRIGSAQVQNAGFTPTAALINPMDAADLDISIWNTAGAGAPSSGSSIWGMQIIPVGAIPTGTAYVGDWSVGAAFFYRGAADIFVSDSDVGLDQISNFKRNIITFLAEMRAKTVVTRPEAIVECTVTVAP